MSVYARRNIARVVGLGLLLAALLLLNGSGNAGADGSGATLAAKGWWWQAQQLPAGIPAPPNVQPGQLNVQSAPTDKDGSAFAAVRFVADPDHTVQSLTLTVAPNGDSGAPAVLLACRTGSAWTPADAGSWSARPTVDSTACINGNKATDGKSWAFPVGTLQVGTLVDVAIVPGVDPTTKQPTPFSLVFDAPTNDSVTTTGFTPPAIAPVLAPPSFGGAGAPAANSFAPSVTPVSVGLPADTLGQTATAPSKQAASQQTLDAALTGVDLGTRDKRVGYLVLAIAALVGLYAWRQDNLIATGAVPAVATDEPGGLGRFARPRNGRPPALT